MTKFFLIFIVLVAVAGGAVLWSRTASPGQEQPEASQSNQQQSPVQTNTIVYSETGYNPKELTVKRGETVIFENESSIGMWPASAIHPTHTAYPGSSILKCGTPEEQSAFDSCREIGPGEEWSFRFNEKGSWKYHDHRIPTRNGTVIVE